jgi:hypothetical protein
LRTDRHPSTRQQNYLCSDGDQHAAALRIVARRTGSIDVAIPASASVASGPYLLFVTVRDADGTRVPSVGAALNVAGGFGSCTP